MLSIPCCGNPQLDDGLADALEAELSRLHGELSASALRIRSVKDELQDAQEELGRAKDAQQRLKDAVGSYAACLARAT